MNNTVEKEEEGLMETVLSEAAELSQQADLQHRLLWVQECELKQLKHFAKCYTLLFSPSDKCGC